MESFENMLAINRKHYNIWINLITFMKRLTLNRECNIAFFQA